MLAAGACALLAVSAAVGYRGVSGRADDFEEGSCGESGAKKAPAGAVLDADEYPFLGHWDISTHQTGKGFVMKPLYERPHMASPGAGGRVEQ